jgi:hypothetical protein
MGTSYLSMNFVMLQLLDQGVTYERTFVFEIYDITHPHMYLPNRGPEWGSEHIHKHEGHFDVLEDGSSQPL